MPLSLVVGLSGGLDSTVLLHLLTRVHQKLPQLFSLRAVHVHHGLQPAADDFDQQCRALCAALAVPLEVIRLSIPAQDIAALGVEAAARKHRYKAFADIVPDQAALVLAHHRDDLLETALLQWIRGAGLEGLSAMKRVSPMTLGNKRIIRWRPLLDQSRQSLLDYAEHEQLQWIEDPTNTSDQFARNRIRHEVMPVLRSLRAGADTAMARSIAHLQTARDLLDLVTDQALTGCLDADSALRVSALLAHEDALAARVLRAWLKQQGAPTPPARRLAEFLRQLRAAKEPFAQMDLGEAGGGHVWRVLRERDTLQIAR
jgi:tRNA(Ile)-lysidine synthase